VTAQAAPVPGAGQVIVDADAEGAGPGQRKCLGGSGGGTRPLRTDELSRHRTQGNRRALEQRDGLASVVGAGPGLLPRGRVALERGVADPGRGGAQA